MTQVLGHRKRRTPAARIGISEKARQGENGYGMDTRIDSKRPPPQRPPRERDSELTRADILAVATKEFADHGLSGARIDRIAALMRTSKRMIYYYFGSKEG